MTADLPTDPTDVPSDARAWAAAAHLLPLLGMGFLGPLVIWLIKRNDDPFVEDQSREALNFQLTLFAYFVVAMALMIAGIFVHGAVVAVAIIAFIGLAIFGLIFTIVGGVQSAQGRLYRYPANIRFVSPRA
ncbi:MAG: DUF4870 domain-containing protein [Acidimicrobiia bacterium]